MDRTVKTVIAVVGAAVSYLFGGWSALLGALLVFVTLDYVTGFAAAAFEGKLSSAVGYKGLTRKIGIFALVAVAHLIDSSFGEAHLVRDGSIFWFLANEALSVVENMGRLGVPIPPVITQAVEVLRKRGAA